MLIWIRSYHDLGHTHDTRHGNITLMAPRPWNVHSAAVLVPLAIYPSKDGVLDDRLPPAPAGTHSPLVAVASVKRLRRVEPISQEECLITHLALRSCLPTCLPVSQLVLQPGMLCPAPWSCLCRSLWCVFSDRGSRGWPWKFNTALLEKSWSEDGNFSGFFCCSTFVSGCTVSEVTKCASFLAVFSTIPLVFF